MRWLPLLLVLAADPALAQSAFEVNRQTDRGGSWQLDPSGNGEFMFQRRGVEYETTVDPYSGQLRTVPRGSFPTLDGATGRMEYVRPGEPARHEVNPFTGQLERVQ